VVALDLWSNTQLLYTIVTEFYASVRPSVGLQILVDEYTERPKNAHTSTEATSDPSKVV
jgi:hypothetical protein